MKAAWFERFGSAAEALSLGDLPTPTPQAGEVLVRLATTGVNPSDVKKRAGAFPNLLDDGLVIPHSDGAGVIEAVGEGVATERVGERVFVYEAQYGRRFGTAAEYVAVPSVRAPMLPDSASFAVGACIGIPMMTAHRCVLADGDVAGQLVLVTGGAGRVGYYAIQWACRNGAKVLATASNDDDAALCRALGAEKVVNHQQEGWGQELLEHTRGARIDRVIDVEFGANVSEILSCIRTGGTIATYSSTVIPEPALPFRKMMFMDLTLRMVLVYAMPETAKASAVAHTQAALSAEHLRHRIAKELPFASMPLSHELIEEGGCGGCVVVCCDT
ncbi:NADPH:quinone reductase [Congregibacter sp.]|uniref:NADPH:quinone reductase n=1 Tax=Congregibacter sp. TaxID=2744308 RepID=UPI003F6C4EF6